MSTTTTSGQERRREEHDRGRGQRHRREESVRSVAGRDRGVEEGEASALARHRDPSARRTRPGARAAGAKRPGRGVEWVRPSDLMTHAGGRLAGAGISFEAELARRLRRAPVTAVTVSRRTIRARQAGRERAGRDTARERADRLPPLSAFGQSRHRPYSWVTRSGIGLG